MSSTEVLRMLVAALDRFGISYMLTGSFASAYHGASRSTQDIDLVIEAAPEPLQAFVGYLQANQYYADVDTALEALEKRSLFNVIEQSSGWKIDLIIRKARPFGEAEFRRRRLVDFNGIPLFLASAEDVVIAKMEWSKMSGSARQLADVAAILRLQWGTLDLDYIQLWTRSLDLQSQLNEVCKLANIKIQ